jgi:sugar lactone lactonase YvrE
VECADGLTFAPDGTLYAFVTRADDIGSAVLVTIDPATGTQTQVGPLPPVRVGAGGMTFDAAGNLWLYATTTGIGDDPDCTVTDTEWCLWRVNPADATSEFIAADPGAAALGVFGLTAACDGEVLAIATPFATGPPIGSSLQTVDTATAALTLKVATPDVVFPQGLDYDASGGLWAVAETEGAGFLPAAVHEIAADGSATTTLVTFPGDQDGFLFGLAISPLSCPEPPPAPAPEVVLTPTFTG